MRQKQIPTGKTSKAPEKAAAGYSPHDRVVYIEHHQPAAQTAYHFHPSVEINLLSNCDMSYSFSGTEVCIKRGQLCVFWAAHPHRVISLQDTGLITNAYVSLSEFLQWPLPKDMVSRLLGGAVLSSGVESTSDYAMAERWAKEVNNTDEKWQRLHGLEVQSRLFRLALDGWEELISSRVSATRQMVGGRSIEPFERMLRYVASAYAEPIKVKDVAAVGQVSESYAISLFRKILGRTIKEHITDMRLFHARMLLSETDSKILTVAMNSGFGSVSSFYEAFHSRGNVSPAAFRRNAATRD
ncbi:MAG: helix-turn-helix domain-containing protein [Granulosicoccus sp.]